ncbi:MAG: hypothetical protein WCK15_18700 [Pirellula sp.]
MRKTYQFATFDIWDTCLTRAFNEPRHLFLEVARRLSGADRFEGPETAELARLRILAEQNARETAPGQECTLDEIENALKRLTGEEIGELFINLELSVEREFVRPVATVREKIQTTREAGSTIAFISDMYLPTDFLSELLQANGFLQPNDIVFVSSEHRANKWTGDLFQIVREKLGAKPSSWSHIGDKRDADVLVPRRMGIKSNHFRGTGLTLSEMRFGECTAAHARNASRIVGGMRAARLSGDQPTVLTDVVAPWLCALAAQMVHGAQKMGLRRLYFLSRDGEILLRIAKRIAPPDLECRYLYSSRRAWCFPAMLADDRPSRRWLETFAVSPNGILASLEFSPDEQVKILKELKLTPEQADLRAAPSECVFVWDHLRATDRIHTVLERASIAREACLAYLDQEGLFEGDRWAICDVGWALNGQAALTRLLRVRQPTAVARGFYFMVNRLRPPLDETGPFNAWLLDEALDSEDMSIPNTLTCLSGLIEEFFLSSAEPTLRGYWLNEETGESVPAFGDSNTDDESQRHSTLLRETVDYLSDEWKSELSDPLFVDDLASASLSELLRFLRHPTCEEATVVSRLHHSSEATNSRERAEALARSMTISDGLSIFARRARMIKKSKTKEPLWNAGCRILTPAWIRAFNQLMIQPIPFRR